MNIIPQMDITVHLHTILQRETAVGLQRQIQLSLSEGSTVQDVAALLEIKMPLDAMLLVVNGRLAHPDTGLKSGDNLHLMPAISGGSPHRAVLLGN